MLSATVGLAAGPFAAPGEGPLPFRRDRVPLEVEDMTGLSRQLRVLAESLEKGKAEERRLTAQTLGLALALDPGNREARDMVEKLVAEGDYSPGDTSDTVGAKARMWQLVEWLETSEAGQDGRALAACLTDIGALVDPFHPKATGHRESGAWRGWIPDLAAYKAPEPKVPDPVDPPPTQGNKNGGSVIVHDSGTLTTPLWVFDKALERSVMKPVKVRMRVEGHEWESFRFRMENTENAEQLDRTSDTVIKALEKLGNRFPEKGRVQLNCDGDYYVSRNRDGISAAAAVLVDSAVTQRVPSATVMGIVGADGSFKLPPRAWDRLRALSGGPGGRLVLPKEAETLLPSILAMEDPGFFIKYEVILAGSLKELVERADKGATGTLAEVSARFAEIQSKQGNMTVGQYAANPFIRKRLADIAQAYPDHASARMLDIQGAGKRPAWLSRPVLSSELRRAMDPAGRLLREDPNHLDPEDFEMAYEEARQLVDPLDRYVDMRERELSARAKEILVDLRALTKLRKNRDNWDDRDRDNSNPRERYERAFSALKRTYESFRQDLDTAAGDAEPPRDDQNRRN